MVSTFELVADVSPSFCPSVRLYKWESRRSGLQAVLIKRKSPSVQGYFTVASEANDDSGCPHTLEHIVFMGSEKFPYKGVLDKLSAMQMSSTNAWTAQDQTCYTLNTAGYEGFLNLLPVYLDHILHATVKDSACVTEVYHIDGKGEEKGVVFSEMQGYEHTSDSLMTVESQKMLFDAQSGYATNTGGNLSALRVLKPETIKQYHKDVYRPNNLSVIVAGDVEPEEIVQVLEEFDSGLAPLPVETRLPRPFVDSNLSTAPSPLKQTEIRTIEFPDSMESSGKVLISWLGPHISDLVANTALQVVTYYLWQQDSGKLEREFVNVPKDKALASTVYGMTSEFLHTQVSLNLWGVPVHSLDKAAKAVLEYLDVRLLKELDFEFLKQCIDTVYDWFVLAAEDRVDTFVDLAICEFLYGSNDTFTKWLGSIDEFDAVRSWTEADWRQFITQYVVDPPKACVLGRPSRDAFIRIDEEKKQRLEEIKATRNLEEDAATLQRAIEENEQDIPDRFLSLFPIPDVSRIRFIKSQSAATPKLIESGLPGSPLLIDDSVQQYLSKQSNLALNFESIASQFVFIKLYISAQSVDKALFPLISIILGNAFASPMKLDDGTELSAEDVSQESKRDLLLSTVYVDNEQVHIIMRAKAENYAKAVMWIKRVMFNLVYNTEYASIFIARHLKNVPEAKRSDQQLLESSIDEIMLTDGSLKRQSDILITEDAVKQFEEDIEGTVEKLKQLSSSLFRPDNIRGLVIANIPQLAASQNILDPWIDLERRFPVGPSDAVAPISWSNHYLSPKGMNPTADALLTLCAASDSTHLNVVSKGPLKYGHPDLPALTVVNTYLDMTEGPLWNAVRGPGYAYGASMSTSVNMGCIVLSIHSAADGMSALKACKQVVEDAVNGVTPVNECSLASVVAQIVGDLASNLAEPSMAIEEKFADTVLKGYPPNYTQKIISEIRSVTVEQFQQVLKQYHLPLFDTATSMVFAVAPPSEETVVKTGLQDMGYNVTVREVDIGEDNMYSGDEDSGSSDEESD